MRQVYDITSIHTYMYEHGCHGILWQLSAPPPSCLEMMLVKKMQEGGFVCLLSFHIIATLFAHFWCAIPTLTSYIPTSYYISNVFTSLYTVQFASVRPALINVHNNMISSYKVEGTCSLAMSAQAQLVESDMLTVH